MNFLEQQKWCKILILTIYEISVTMDVYTHLGLDDAKDEIIRLKELEYARKEINNIERDTMRSMESQFKYI